MLEYLGCVIVVFGNHQKWLEYDFLYLKQVHD